MALLVLPKAPPDWYWAGAPLRAQELDGVSADFIDDEERTWAWRRCRAPMSDFGPKLHEDLEAFVAREFVGAPEFEWARCEAVRFWMAREGAAQGLERSPLIFSIEVANRRLNVHDGLHRLAVAHHCFGVRELPAIVGIASPRLGPGGP